MSRRQRAEVQRFKTAKLGSITTQERAVLPCGCAIYVGRDAADPAHPVVTAAQPCSGPHTPLTDRSSGILREMIKTPRPNTLLVETCKAALSRAAKEMDL